MKSCECGCGNPAPIASKTNSKSGYLKGEPMRFINGHNSRGSNNINYRGGLTMFRGRWYITLRNGKKELYARAVMECHLKRPLSKNELVHHTNEKTDDDRIENLQLSNRAEHNRIHAKNNFDDQWLLNALVGLAETIGRTPQQVDINACKKIPSAQTYLRRFGGIKKALNLAGVSTNTDCEVSQNV